jgi:hypothetical protein
MISLPLLCRFSSTRHYVPPVSRGHSRRPLRPCLVSLALLAPTRMRRLRAVASCARPTQTRAEGMPAQTLRIAFAMPGTKGLLEGHAFLARLAHSRIIAARIRAHRALRASHTRTRLDSCLASPAWRQRDARMACIGALVPSMRMGDVPNAQIQSRKTRDMSTTGGRSTSTFALGSARLDTCMTENWIFVRRAPPVRFSTRQTALTETCASHAHTLRRQVGPVRSFAHCARQDST